MILIVKIAVLNFYVEANIETFCHCEKNPRLLVTRVFCQATSSGQQDYMAFQSSCVVGGTVNVMQPAINCGGPSSMLMNPSCNRNINLGFPPAGQVNSSMSISLSTITGESSAADYQDCGLSPVFLPGEAPWESGLEASSPQARDKAKMRYHEKKKTRTYVAVFTFLILYNESLLYLYFGPSSLENYTSNLCHQLKFTD